MKIRLLLIAMLIPAFAFGQLDIVKRNITATDTVRGKIFKQGKDTLATMADVRASSGGGGAVTSVNGQTGDVVIDKTSLNIGNVDNTSDANKPISTATQTALDAKQNILSTSNGLYKSGNELKQLTNSIIYQKSYFTDYSEFTATGFTPTIVNNSVQFTGGSNTFNQYLTLNNNNTINENITIEEIVKVITVGNGIGIGKKSNNSWYPGGICLKVNTTDNSLSLYDPESGSLATSKSMSVIIATNDILRIRLLQNGTTFTGIVEDLTQNSYDVISITHNLSASTAYRMPNSGKFATFNFGGTHQLMSINILNHVPFAPDVLCVGDSKTVGFGGSGEKTRYSAYLNKLGNVYTYAGSGDRTVELINDTSEIKAINPKYVILNIGRNDLASSVSSSTWQTNYQNIVNAIQRGGTTVIHLLGIGETSQNQTALYNWINSTYSNNKIDVSSGWNNSTMLNADNVHPNNYGYQYISNQIINSNLIPLNKNYTGNLMDLLPRNNTQAQLSAVSNVNNQYSSSVTNLSNGGAAQSTFLVKNDNSDYGGLTIGSSQFSVVKFRNNVNIFGTKDIFISSDALTTTNGTHKIYFISGGFQNSSSLTINPGNPGNVGIGTDNPSSKSKLDITSTTQGFLMPRMTTTQRDAITSPDEGLQIYNLTDHVIQYWNGTTWKTLTAL